MDPVVPGMQSNQLSQNAGAVRSVSVRTSLLVDMLEVDMLEVQADDLVILLSSLTQQQSHPASSPSAMLMREGFIIFIFIKL